MSTRVIPVVPLSIKLGVLDVRYATRRVRPLRFVTGDVYETATLGPALIPHGCRESKLDIRGVYSPEEPVCRGKQRDLPHYDFQKNYNDKNCLLLL